MEEQKFTYKYPHPAVATDCVVFGFDGKKLKVLLIRRGVEPFKGLWAFPGGFMRMDETAEQCALRELVEETGLELTQMKQLGVFSDIDRDPRERVISVAFYALAKSSEVRGGDDAAIAKWFAIDDVPHLAFDHDYILRQAMRKIKEDIHFEPVGFGLLDEEFTIAELQRLYEAILGVHFDRRNFHKKLLQTGILEEVEEDDDVVAEKNAPSYYGHHNEIKSMKIDALFGTPKRFSGRISSFICTEPSASEPKPEKGTPGRKGKLFRFKKDKYDKLKENNEFRLEF
jgi:8-oxo-dGTP diphosphatase